MPITIAPLPFAPEISRSVMAADPDGSMVPRYDTGHGSILWVGATCTTPGASLFMSLLLFGSSGILMGRIALQFTSASAPDFGSSYAGILTTGDWAYPIGGVSSIAFKADLVAGQGAVWSINGALA